MVKTNWIEKCKNTQHNLHGADQACWEAVFQNGCKSFSQQFYL